ncbi:ABC transporter permease [Candidatus Babeliales bacterium]|nr:ABC transporter permease [Candidatus Babeliales bacterium]
MNNKTRAHSATIFFKLLGTRLQIASHQLRAKLVNIQIWSICTLVIFGHVMQTFGLAGDFGLFQLAGIIATAGLFENYSNIATIIMDFAGERSIGYYLTLPVQPSVVLFSSACAYATIGTLLSLSMLVVGKILFFASFNLAAVAWCKLIAITVLSNLFYGMLALAIAAHVGKVAKIGNVWSRFIFPLWFLGGFQFSWAAMHKAWPPLAYGLLANPITYIMEGTRAALLGQQDFFSWWTCMGMLTLFTLACWCAVYNRMKKQLDFV